jgi:hypothetical protein
MQRSWKVARIVLLGFPVRLRKSLVQGAILMSVVLNRSLRRRWNECCDEASSFSLLLRLPLSLKDRTMKSIQAFLIAPLFLIAAGCAEQLPTMAELGPTGAAFAKGGDKDGGGGVASPHFALDRTSCSFSETVGEMECDYKLSGLGRKTDYIVTMVGLVKTTWDCVDNTGATVATGVNELRLNLDVQFRPDARGNATGRLNAQPEDLTPTINYCPSYVTGSTTVNLGTRFYPILVVIPTFASSTVQNIRFSLDPEASTSEPTQMGVWALFAAAVTAKGPLTFDFYAGALRSN